MISVILKSTSELAVKYFLRRTKSDISRFYHFNSNELATKLNPSRKDFECYDIKVLVKIKQRTK